MLLAAASWEWLPMFVLAVLGGEAFIHIWMEHYLDVGCKGTCCVRRY